MNIKFQDLFKQCEEKFEKQVTSNGNEVIKVSGISVLGASAKYVNIVAISRHYVTKDRYKIHVYNSAKKCKKIETTDDHTCIRWNQRYQIEQVKASQLKQGDVVFTYEDANNEAYRQPLGVVQLVQNLGPWNDYVYDLEVEDNSHMFYANDILIHNSQFIDISPIVDSYIKKNNLPINDMSSLNQTQLDELIAELDDFVDNDVNVYIKDLVNKECHTTQGGNLHYSREYVASQAMFFKKKHYIVHIVKKDNKTVDQFKYSGVSVKKAEIPGDMKVYLKNIFEETCIKNWKQSDYRKYIDYVFDEFLKKNYEDISIYRTYSTEKASTGYMISEKGAGAHAKSANIYNQLIDELKISNKYEKINLGDQLRYCYINDTNPYGINIIAFKDYVPDEFKKIFTINYDLMFDKIFLSSLKGYISIMKFNEYSPNNKAICDISEL